MPVPSYDDLFNPLLEAIHQLGGSATTSEQEDTVASILSLTDDDVAEIHRGNRTILHYRLCWARNSLKNYGLLDNSARAIWSLTAKGRNTRTVDKEDVKRVVKALRPTPAAASSAVKGKEPAAESSEVPTEEATTTRWEDELLDLLKSLPPEGFERLCQRLLRECGFVQVEVTTRGADGGIDGKGVWQLGGLLSFHVVFQCKRYKGTVGSSVVRDFRGAIMGRGDKGLIITTGVFTRDARKEAQRDGTIPIDLIDGEALATKLKDLRLGIEVNKRVVEDVEIDKNWFEAI